MPNDDHDLAGRACGVSPAGARHCPIPDDDAARLASLDEYALLGSDPETSYDLITQLGADMMQVPICLISIVGQDLQWLKSRTGLDVESTPRDVAFCAHTIMTADLLVVPDATRDPRFRANPLVTGSPGIRFYAGAPLITREGVTLGALCLIDTVPHHDFGARDRGLLQRLAAIVSDRFDKRLDALIQDQEEHAARQTLQQQRDEIADRTAYLEGLRKDVLKVVADIDDLSRRSRTLAVNAAIEAARVGESGNAFSIVAAEVKRLAEDTREATTRAAVLLAA